jgi:competence protein ComEA
VTEQPTSPASDQSPAEPSGSPAPAVASSEIQTAPAAPKPLPFIGDLLPPDQAFVAVVVVGVFLTVTLQSIRYYGWGRPPIAIVDAQGQPIQLRLDPNRANWFELSQLDGLGETLAKRIVAYREAHGPFQTISDISKVDGIGNKKLEQLAPYLQLDNSQPPNK